jgi:hypothetical protein
MNRSTPTGSAAGVSEPDHRAPTDYTRTSERAQVLGFHLQATEIEGAPAFLVSRWGMSRVLPDLAAVEVFLNRAAGAGVQAPASLDEGDAA